MIFFTYKIEVLSLGNSCWTWGQTFQTHPDPSGLDLKGFMKVVGCFLFVFGSFFDLETFKTHMSKASQPSGLKKTIRASFFHADLLLR